MPITPCPNTRQIEYLESRIAALEGQGSGGSDDVTIRPAQTQVERAAEQHCEPHPGDSPSIATRDTSSVGSDGTQHRRQQSPFDLGTRTSTGRVDGMGAIASSGSALFDIEPEKTGFFGSSSTVSFTAKVRHILARPDGDLFDDVQPALCRQIIEDYAIPARPEADSILALFWDRIYPLYPFIDRPSFEKSYGQLWSPASTTSRTANLPYQNLSGVDPIPESRRFHLLLNAMFALACSWDGLDGYSVQKGDLYWRRCKQLMELDFDIFNVPRLSLVQGFLYTGLYLQSTTEMTSACWNIIGISVRMSQTLGLHCGAQRQQDGAEHESYGLRWRIWVGCVVMDRNLSTIYGRPSMVGFSAPIPRPPTLGQSRGDSKSTSFLSSLGELSVILKHMVKNVYDCDDDHDLGISKSRDAGKPTTMKQRFETGNFQDFLDFEVALANWEQGLPSELRMPATMTAALEQVVVDAQSVLIRMQ
ncbi:uncharacterized protein A1O9_07999 [Exophiala aquamarina CBS 119918]|uniref:Xylanolytic transcriptional activator regulatory domain-containing protein n=1 Tax=Exophiala aquamarina CBS 119918 TaxID=1182545 RepID=A0A072PAX0_9EURO|nr:uncharacterized protein A1O9_07999 [Exophiala aquamarina CBS 119918]KEF56418.1 hypothetical protein A1O9_07999 [Exophiala aquamarina CBS 119918]